MEEKTKEIKKIEDLEEIDEETSHTKQLDVISEEEILKDEIVEENNEEEIEQLEEINEDNNEENIVSEKKVPEKKKSKKILLIVIGIIVILLVTILIIIILLNKQKKEIPVSKNEIVDYSDYGNAIKNSIEKGKLDKIIKEELEKNNIKTETVTLLNIDIDSDNRQDLVVYASDNSNNNKILLNLNVKEEVSYEKSYKLDSKESIGYIYNKEADTFYWYVENNKKICPIDNHSTYINKEDERFIYYYYILTTKYKNENIIEYGLKYNFDKKLDIEELEEKEITNNEIISDAKINKEEVRRKLEDYLKEYSDKKKAEYEKSLKDREEKFKKEIPEETAKKVLLVAITNYLAADTKDEKGNYDVSKFHDSSYDGEYKLTVKEEGNCKIIDYDRYWHCVNMNVFDSRIGYIVLDSQIYKDKSNYIINKFFFANSEEKFEVDGNITSLDPYPFLKVSEDLIK